MPVRSDVSATFCRPSCTLFSPKSRWPAANAARTCSAGNVLETAIRVIASGSRCARAAAAAMRARTWLRLSAMTASEVTRPPLLAIRLQRLEVRLCLFGVGAGGRQLQVGLELRCRFAQFAEVDQHPSEHEVCLGVCGIRLHCLRQQFVGF